MASEEGMHPHRIVFTSRWWRNAGIAFLALVPVCVPLFFIAAFVAGLSGRAWLLYLVVALPFLGSVVVATLIEATSAPEPPIRGSHLLRRGLLTVAAFALWPVVIGSWVVVKESRTAQRSGRPIVLTEEVGFCAPLRWGVRDSLPWIEITTRVPRREMYRWLITAIGGDSAVCSGSADSILDKGVHAVVVTLEPQYPARALVWPVRVQDVHVFSIPYLSAESQWSDYREGSFLPVIEGPSAP